MACLLLRAIPGEALPVSRLVPIYLSAPVVSFPSVAAAIGVAEGDMLTDGIARVLQSD